MANWLSEIDDDQQQSIDQMNAAGLGKAPKQSKEVGLFDGLQAIRHDRRYF